MLLKLVNLFSFFSVVMRAGTLVCQSILLGGVLFLFWIARRSHEESGESIGRIWLSAWQLLRISAVGLVVVQLLIRRCRIDRLRRRIFPKCGSIAWKTLFGGETSVFREKCYTSLRFQL
jgi:hypothetical protein